MSEDHAGTDHRKTKIERTDNERFVQVCLQTAQQMRIVDPFYVALEMKGWSRDDWDEQRRKYELRKVQRWMPVGEGGCTRKRNAGPDLISGTASNIILNRTTHPNRVDHEQHAR